MYSKLFARITESSLMEEPIPARYTFLMMLAIADPEGYVIGTDIAIARRINLPLREFESTDIAIARRINLPLREFESCVASLMQPDPHSNSPAHDGRIIRSDGERGYYLVNYKHYRALRNEDDRREYMRQYMADYRARKPRKLNGKLCKPRLAQAEGDCVNRRSAHSRAHPNPQEQPQRRKSRHGSDSAGYASTTAYADAHRPPEAPHGAACQCRECREAESAA